MSRRRFLGGAGAVAAGAWLPRRFSVARIAHAAGRPAEAPSSPAAAKVDWQKHKAIVFENDDWGGHGRFASRDREVYQRAFRTPEIRAVFDYQKGSLREWSTAIVENPEEMQRLFDFLLEFKGADGRPALFTPIYIVANPDYEAIRANHFEAYVDLPISKGFPAGLNPGDILGKAREGVALGVWYPQTHGRAHHYSGKKWVRTLREKKDRTLWAFFELNGVGWPTPPWGEHQRDLKGLEFDDMGDRELDEWFQTGLRYFREAFGYETPAAPITDARPDNLKQCQQMLVRARITIQSHTQDTLRLVGEPQCPMGTEDPPGVLRMGWTAIFDPRGKRDADCDRGCTAAYERIVRSWKCNLPAVVGGHRINYSSLDPNQVKEGYAQLGRLLSRIAKEHPDAVYLTSTEVGQLYRTGTSVLRQAQRITCRNYTQTEQVVQLPDPGAAARYVARHLRSGSEIRCRGEGAAISFRAPPGEYAIEPA
jgi:hypothetical protein